MSEDYWDGGTWVYQADITNDAMDIANQEYSIQPGAGNEMEILYGFIQNEDTSTRTIFIRIDDGAGNFLLNYTISTAAGLRAHIFPTVDNENRPNMSRYVVSGTMRFIVSVLSVAVSQDSRFGIVCRIRGGAPTVTESASAGVPVININTEQVF